MPFEIKNLIFDHVLENALQFDYQKYHGCTEAFPSRYARFLWTADLVDLDMKSADSFLEDTGWDGDFHIPGSVHDCLTSMIDQGWDKIENLSATSPDIADMVCAMIRKKFHALCTTFRDDCRRISESVHETNATLRAAVAVQGIEKEVLKVFCWQSHFAYDTGSLVYEEHGENQEEAEADVK